MKVKLDHAASAYKVVQNIFSSNGAKNKESSDAIVREFPGIDGSKFGVVYSKDHESVTSAYVLDIGGGERAIKPENLPKELSVIHDAGEFGAFLRQAYIRSVSLSDGEEKVYIEHIGLGGMPPKRSDEPIEMDEIRALVASGTRMIDEKFGESCKEAIITLGPTGVGKSTLLNLLFGVPLKAVASDRADLPIVAKPGSELLFNASASFVSETSVPQREDLPYGAGGAITFVDCPGFGDTRGLRQEIVNAFCVKGLFPKIEKAKILVVIPESAVETAGRGASIKSLVEDLHNILGDFTGTKMNSVAVIFTNVRPEHGIEHIRKSLDDLADAEESRDPQLSAFCSGIRHIGVFHRPVIGDIPAEWAAPILSMLNNKVRAMPVSDPAVAVSAEARYHLSAIVNQEVTALEARIPAARIALTSYIEGLSNTSLNELKIELEKACVTGDKVENITALINEKLKEHGVDFDAVTRVLDFVVSIDVGIAGEATARYGRAVTTLADDMSVKVKTETEKRAKEEEAQRLKREADEAQKRLYELEYKKTWTTAIADIAKSTVTAICGAGTALAGAYAERLKTTPTDSGSAGEGAVKATGGAGGGSAPKPTGAARKVDERRQQFIEAARKYAVARSTKATTSSGDDGKK